MPPVVICEERTNTKLIQHQYMNMKALSLFLYGKLIELPFKYLISKNKISKQQLTQNMSNYSNILRD